MAKIALVGMGWGMMDGEFFFLRTEMSCATLKLIKGNLMP